MQRQSTNCKQGASNNISVQIGRPQKVKDTNTNIAKELEEQLPVKETASQTCRPLL